MIQASQASLFDDFSSQLRGYVNGVLMVQATDTSHASGRCRTGVLSRHSGEQRFQGVPALKRARAISISPASSARASR